MVGVGLDGGLRNLFLFACSRGLCLATRITSQAAMTEERKKKKKRKVERQTDERLNGCTK